MTGIEKLRQDLHDAGVIMRRNWQTFAWPQSEGLDLPPKVECWLLVWVGQGDKPAALPTMIVTTAYSDGGYDVFAQINGNTVAGDVKAIVGAASERAQ